jgi:hypothetical protein
MVRQNLMAVGTFGEGSCSSHGRQEAETRGRDQRPHIIFKGTTLAAYFLQLGLKISPPPKIAPPIGNQAFNT